MSRPLSFGEFMDERRCRCGHDHQGVCDARVYHCYLCDWERCSCGAVTR